MADVGTTSQNLPLGTSSTPNADAFGVDPSLDSLAAYLADAQAAWVAHDAATVNDNLQTFWSAEGEVDPSTLSNQSMGTLIGGTIQQDLTALDGYSHRILGYEYLNQMSTAAPADIPAILALQVTEFQNAVNDWNSAGLTQQAADDQNILTQSQGWAGQTSSAWIDTSYMASVQAVIAQDVAAAGNLVTAAGSALLSGLNSALASVFGSAQTGYLLIGGVLVGGLLLWRSKK